jgi:RimJ/RimL family protein N-acetyltransferase
MTLSATNSEPTAGPFQVSDSIFLTVIETTDEDEVFRILNINDSIANGLHSAKMVFPFSRESTTYFIHRQVSKRMNDKIVHNWAIRTSQSGPMIGLINLRDFDHDEDLGPCYRDNNSSNENTSPILRCGAFGYWISPEWTGQGIMTSVIRFFLEQVARPLFGFDRVHGEAWLDNRASSRVMEKAGMRPTRSVPCFVEKFNATKDIAHYIFDT